MDSLFIINKEGEPVLERHAVGSALTNSKRAQRYVDIFRQQLIKDSGSPIPIIPTPTLNPHCLAIFCNEKDGLFLVCPVSRDRDPLLIMEFLNRIWELFEEYFGKVTEQSLKLNFVIVQYLLDEVMDNGMPFITESNVLTSFIRPADVINKVIKIDVPIPFRSTIAPDLPEGLFTNTPWRKKNTRYASNDLFVDLEEEMDCSMDYNGFTNRCEVYGAVRINCKLNGQPTVEIQFNRPEMFFDESFHPCVLTKSYDQTKNLRFIPPDGKFTLMNYRIQGKIAPPIMVKCKYLSNQIAIEVQVSGAVQNLVLSIPWDDCLLTSTITATKGQCKVDPLSKYLNWTLGSVDKPEQKTKLSLTATIPAGESPDRLFSNPINISFKAGASLTGIKIQNIEIHGEKELLRIPGFEKYAKPFKGTKYLSRTGNFSVQPNAVPKKIKK